MKNNTTVIIGIPRSGTSLVAKLCVSSGLNLNIFEDSKFFGSSPHNPTGYNEEVRLTLLNDQIIRSVFNNKFSFLYPPKISNYDFDIYKKISDFEYDINEHNIEMPCDYLNELNKYTGHNYDVWGLSRMHKNQRWYKGYSKFGVNEGYKILKEINRYSIKLNQKNNFLIKDPRLVFTLPFFKLKKPKLIIVERSVQETVKSLRSHYGPRFLTNRTFDGYSWVSNHFNLKAGPMNRNSFFDLYNNALNYLKNMYKDNLLLVNYNKLIDKDNRTISRIEDFLGLKINLNWIIKK